MCGTAMRGADALPGSKATSRANGSHRKLGGLASGRQMLRERDGPHREGEEPKPMMHGHEKSDPAIVAVKPANKAERSAAESVEPRAGTKGNAGQQSTRRTRSRTSVSQALERIRKVAVNTRGGSRMRESRTYGSVRGARGNSRPYREDWISFQLDEAAGQQPVLDWERTCRRTQANRKPNARIAKAKVLSNRATRK
jgi:hypothetical protein